VAIGEAGLEPDHPHVAVWRNDLGSVLQALGDLEGARAQYERALAIGEAALDPDHPTVATIRGNLDGVLGALQEGPGEDPGPHV
jgi:Flp pilus assembly protein TadD